MAGLQIFLFSYRIVHPIDFNETTRIEIAIGNVFLLFLMISKVFFYLKIYDRFSVINNLITSIISQLMPFLTIFILFTWFFALSYYVLGGYFESIKPSELGHMIYAFAAFFNSYEMSTGEEHNIYLRDP